MKLNRIVNLWPPFGEGFVTVVGVPSVDYEGRSLVRVRFVGQPLVSISYEGRLLVSGRYEAL